MVGRLRTLGRDAIYACGLWLLLVCSIVFCNACFEDSYAVLAALCAQKRIYGYQMRPKLHMMAHIVLRVGTFNMLRYTCALAALI